MADVEFEMQYDPSSLERKSWDSATLEPNQTSKHALVFSISEQNLAIAADFIEQIVELPKVLTVPSAGSGLLGLADHAGLPIPVVDIAPLINLDSAIDDFRHGLLLNHKGLRVMLAIEAVVVLKELSIDEDIKLPASYQSAGFAQYACTLTNANAYSTKSDRADEATALQDLDSKGAQKSKSATPVVIVLDVPQLLAAVQNAAAARPVS